MHDFAKAADTATASGTDAMEAARLSAVRRYDVLDTPPDGSFDRITALAARLFNVPVAIITIIDHDRIWFKSRFGLALDQIGRDDGLCATTIMSAFPRVLTDAKLDTCALTNPLVAGDFGLRFYVGIPLRTFDGHNLGTLCVLDTQARSVTQAEIDNLSDLASVVMDLLELRISARHAVAREQLMAKEIDHRVMNSLQLISNILILQSRDQVDTQSKGELQKAASRVLAISQVHRNFYAGAVGQTACLSFLRRLCGEMSNILNLPIEVKGDEDLVPTALIQPIGLIANEFVTNAAKYGAGKIVVSYTCRGGLQELSICNDGVPLPADFSPALSKGLGMRVILSLVTQLQGQLLCGPGPSARGACFTVSFKIPT